MRQSLILIFTLILLQSCAFTPFRDNSSLIENNYSDNYAQVYPQEIKASREVANEVSCVDLVERILKLDESNYSKVIRQEPFAAAQAQAKVDSALDKYPVNLSSTMRNFRDRFLGWFKNTPQREPITRSFEAALRMRSLLTKEAILKNGGKADYDLVIVGTGVHGVIALHEALTKNPKLRILLVDEGDTAGATFRYGKELFSINSSNRASGVDTVALPGRGNINELPGFPIQVSDQTGVKYPTANDLGISIVTGLYAAVKEHPGVDVLFGTQAKDFLAELPEGLDSNVNEVIKIVSRNNPEEVMQIGAQKVIISTGLGAPKVPAKLAETLQKNPDLLKSKNGKIPKVINFEDLIRMLAMSNDPVSLIKNLKIGVVGSGDSANVFIEFLLGYAARDAYGNSVAQDGKAAKIYWIGQKKLTCEDFIKDIRSRYQGVSTGFRSSSKDVEAILTSLPAKLGDVQSASSGRVMAKLEDGSTSPELDFVVLTTGFEQDVRALFSSITKGESNNFEDDIAFFKNSFETLEGRTSASGGKSVQVGRKYNGREIYVLGTAAGKLTEEKELVGVVQNFVSIFNNAPRVVATTKLLVDGLSAKVGSFKASKVLIGQSVEAPKVFVVQGIQETRTMNEQTLPYLQSVFNEALNFVVTSKNEAISFRVGLDSDGLLKIHGDNDLDLEKFVKLLAGTREFFGLSKEVLKLMDGKELEFSSKSLKALDEKFYAYNPESSLKIVNKTTGEAQNKKIVKIENQQIQLRGLDPSNLKKSSKGQTLAREASVEKAVVKYSNEVPETDFPTGIPFKVVPKMFSDNRDDLSEVSFLNKKGLSTKIVTRVNDSRTYYDPTIYFEFKEKFGKSTSSIFYEPISYGERFEQFQIELIGIAAKKYGDDFTFDVKKYEIFFKRYSDYDGRQGNCFGFKRLDNTGFYFVDLEDKDFQKLLLNLRKRVFDYLKREGKDLDESVEDWSLLKSK